MALCGTHIKENCPLCNKPDAALEPPPPVKAGATEKGADTKAPVETRPPSPEPLKVSDPAQQQVIDAAIVYSDSIQAVAVTTSHLNEARETVKALESKLAELKKRAKDALAKTQEAVK